MLDFFLVMAGGILIILAAHGLSVAVRAIWNAFIIWMFGSGSPRL